MTFRPFELMHQRLSVAKQDSDIAYFVDLTLFGELLTKLVVGGLLSAVQIDPNRLAYSLAHRLVRADGVGDWASVLEEIVTGPASQFLDHEAMTEQKQLTVRVDRGSWQYQAVERIHWCIKEVDRDAELLPARLDLRRWFKDFAHLRNKTKGHGAPTAVQQARMAPVLADAIDLVQSNFHLFQREWAFVHRNLSGKYFVAPLTGASTRFAELKSKNTHNHQNGVYVGFSELRRFDLLHTERDVADFFLPNGGYNDRNHELLSYVSGERRHGDSSVYSVPPGPLPQSETSGRAELYVLGKCFSNAPDTISEYVRRSELEQELQSVLLMEDQHPIISLHGRGGIGKTSLALKVVHDIAEFGRFTLILWFSARDIDLRTQGPKPVTAEVLGLDDIAKRYVRLVAPKDVPPKTVKATEHFRQVLGGAGDERVLMVFDNFETVRNPGDLFHSIDAFIRNPVKALITTRHREFKGDYPIKVDGMSETEFEELVDRTATKLGIRSMINDRNTRDLYDETGGHPYVAKMILGTMARTKGIAKIERIMASADEILVALFERTYLKLSPAAQRCFLTICNWRSQIPAAALEAVLLLSSEERFNVGEAIEELEQLSFIEIERGDAGDEDFIRVPLVAAQFGQRKLATSPLRDKIQTDTALLVQFGASQKGASRRGIEPHVRRIIRYVAERVQRGQASVDHFRPMLEFLARRFALGWLLLAEVHEEFAEGAEASEKKKLLEYAKECVRRFIESVGGEARTRGWLRLAEICERDDDLFGVIHARAELSADGSVEYYELSKTAELINRWLGDGRLNLDKHEKTTICERLARAMWQRHDEGTATDLSRVAWLFLHTKQVPMAVAATRRGLEMESYNPYCLRLKERLEASGDW